MTDYIISEKGDEVISERHQKDFKKDYMSDNDTDTTEASTSESAESRFTDVDFDDI